MRLAASIMVFALLMAIHDGELNSGVRALIAALAMASLAVVIAMYRSARGEGQLLRPDGRPSPVLWMTTGIYALSWFLPVIEGGWTLERGLPGWEALTTVLHPLWDLQSFKQEPWSSLLWVVSGLTNVFMVAALLRGHFGTASTTRTWRWAAWRWAAWLAFAVNLFWIILDWQDQSLRIGFYLWVLSFALLAVSSTSSRARPASGEAQPAGA